MAGISTHVLDTSKGRPAEGIPVTLEMQREDASWETVGEGTTDADGRLRTLTEGHDLQRTQYRLIFQVAAYTDAFFPEVTLQFRVEEPGEHHHVPLLLSPFGYTTYRGS